MTNMEKIGQMLMFGFPGPALDEDAKHLIEDYKIANVILFSHNIVDAYQLRALCVELRRRIWEATGQPAFISIDQEGGVVSRLPRDATNFPSAMAVSATGNPENAYWSAYYTSLELRALGINFNFAPVADLNTNEDNPVIGVRSYGDTPERAMPYILSSIRGLRDGGVVAVAKHFPGHGDTAVDSHLGLPRVDKTLDELFSCELKPFIGAVNEGVPCVMSSHILFPELEKAHLPATLSRSILTGLLRERIGFQGLIVSDSMEMDAIKMYYGVAKGSVLAMQAGMDLTCITHTMSFAAEASELAQQALSDGRISMRQVDDSVNRILQYKQPYAPPLPADISCVGCAQHRQAAQKMSQESITCLSPGKKMPKVDKDALFIGSYAYRSTIASSEVDKKDSFPEVMAEYFQAQFIITPVDPSPEDIQKILKILGKVRPHQTVVIGTYNGHLNKGQISLCNAVSGAKAELIAVALRNPYDLSAIDSNAYKLAAFEYTPLSFNSVKRILSDERQPQGKLNITVKC